MVHDLEPLVMIWFTVHDDLRLFFIFKKILKIKKIKGMNLFKLLMYLLSIEN